MKEEKTNEKIASIFVVLCLLHSGTTDGGEEIHGTYRPSGNSTINKLKPQCRHKSLDTLVDRTLSNCCI